jgi:hypothetical protein
MGISGDAGSQGRTLANASMLARIVPSGSKFSKGSYSMVKRLSNPDLNVNGKMA